ncbi:MAG: sodium:glutamate symporter [Planctomycetota bacterium]|nr:sodium:glutamate symporter [Planctomycetota bacterium]
MQTAFLVAALLLMAGFVFRARLAWLQRLYIPASILGGLIGLVLVQLTLQMAAPHIEGTAVEATAQETGADPGWWVQGIHDCADEWKSWPGWLIAVVFAGLLLDRQARPVQQSLRLAAREGIVVWIVVLGQTTVGLLVTWLIIQRFAAVPDAFGMLIEVGFAGGHGTAAAMGQIFESETVGLNAGTDLGTFMATVGLVFSVLSGIVYVNIAMRRGWTRAGEVTFQQVTGLEARSNPQPVALGRVHADVIDPLLFQAVILTIAFGTGWVLRTTVAEAVNPVLTAMAQQSFQQADTNRDGELDIAELRSAGSGEEASRQLLVSDLDRDGTINRGEFSDPGIGFALVAQLKTLPLFIYTLLGGLLVRKAAELLRLADLIDGASVQRLTGAAMDLLVVAAIASLNLTAVFDVWKELGLLIVAAFLWTGFCLLVVARRLLPAEYWFELGIINYGMSTGTTATGFVLARIVDKNLDSGAAEDYALAAPLSAPFIGGGILTLLLPTLITRTGTAWIAIPLVLVLVGLFILGLMLRQRPANSPS